MWKNRTEHKKKIWDFENNPMIERFNSLINLNIANISETQLRTKFKNSHKVEARNWHFHIQTCPRIDMTTHRKDVKRRRMSHFRGKQMARERKGS